MTHEPAPEPEPTKPLLEPAADDDAPISLRDRWWWSPVLAIVVGLAVAGYQWGPITGTDGIFLNWVVAGIGVVVALTGVVRLVRAYPR